MSGNGEGLKELIKGSPLEQAAQSVLRQLGTSPTDGQRAEVIRSVELPPLQDLREGDLGSLILGDWIQLVTPTMKDLSATSWKWWEDVLNFAMVAYREWLQAEPVQRLYIRPRLPSERSGVWSRLEQRGQLMLINAVPQSIKAEILASRTTTSSVEVLYALFRRYQPGGLAERSRLLRQLVEPKVPQTMNEVTEALRGWRRSLRRAQELEIATPDATLLLRALDKAIRETLTSPEFQVKRMDLDAWKRHLLNGHLPYIAENASLASSPHHAAGLRRGSHMQTPIRCRLTPLDRSSWQRINLGKGRYLLVGVYLAPVTKDGQSLIPIHEEDELLGGRWTGAHGGRRGGDGSWPDPWPGLDDEKEWLSRVEVEQDFQVKQVTFAEVMENRGGSAVLEAVGRMVAKLNFLGFPLKRLHSDRAGEYQSRMFDKWIRDRGLCRTFTDGDNFGGNGAECAVAQLKRGARTLLVAAGLDESYWCHASRHWAEGRLRRQLESMGCLPG